MIEGMERESRAIGKAHARSESYGINPEENSPRIMLSDRETERERMKNLDLINISLPFIEELQSLLGEENGFITLLSDNTGLIMEVFGKDDDIKKAAGLNLKKGVNMDERSIGTNAMGTAIKERKAVQISGVEHYMKHYQRWTCSAAPIFDSNDNIIGVLNLTAEKDRFMPYIHGLLKTTVKAIENRIHNYSIQRQLYDAQQYAFSIMNHLTFGLIAIDLKGEIHWVNDTACRSLNIRRTKLVNQDVSIICPGWERLRDSVDKNEQVLDEEGELNARNSSEKYLLSAYSITNPKGDVMGYVISFRPFSRMLRLINKYAQPHLNYTFDKIVFKSKKMRKLVSYAKTIANTPSTILITGESGTGKEVFAQAIHNASDRKSNSFVAINCGAISATLIESELFGYEEGAFTGASKGGKPGKFEMADKGTLFLDEIGEMHTEMQVKLLRVIQDKTITRLGGGKTKKVDVRIIAATNKNLEAEVKKGNFRQDLFYRLSVIPLYLPPLRERKMDVPPLFHFFLKQMANKLDRPIPPADHYLLEKLVKYDWPGNIRELENFAEKAVILGGNREQLFPKEVTEEEPSTIPEGTLLQVNDSEELPSLREVEKQVIEKYLQYFDNNLSKTAKKLGIGRNTLYQKIRKHKIEIG